LNAALDELTDAEHEKLAADHAYRNALKDWFLAIPEKTTEAVEESPVEKLGLAFRAIDIHAEQFESALAYLHQLHDRILAIEGPATAAEEKLETERFESALGYLNELNARNLAITAALAEEKSEAAEIKKIRSALVQMSFLGGREEKSGSIQTFAPFDGVEDASVVVDIPRSPVNAIFK
jgi:hypothetical protein